MQVSNKIDLDVRRFHYTFFVSIRMSIKTRGKLGIISAAQIREQTLKKNVIQTQKCQKIIQSLP